MKYMKTDNRLTAYVSPKTAVIEILVEGVLANSTETWDEVDLSNM